MDSNHHQPDSESGGLPLADQAKKVGEGGFEPPTARFQTAHADLTALLAEEVGGRVGHRSGSRVAARAR